MYLLNSNYPTSWQKKLLTFNKQKWQGGMAGLVACKPAELKHEFPYKQDLFNVLNEELKTLIVSIYKYNPYHPTYFVWDGL